MHLLQPCVNVDIFSISLIENSVSGKNMYKESFQLGRSCAEHAVSVIAKTVNGILGKEYWKVSACIICTDAHLKSVCNKRMLIKQKTSRNKR